jgi:AcrR family transcriptional regulator
MLTNSVRRERREAELLDAALDLFAEYGFRKASVDDIARRLGVAPGTIYLYAADKRDLYRKAVERAFRSWQEAVRKAIEAEAEPVERFRAACRTAFANLAGEPRLRGILAREPELFPVASGEDPFAEINGASIALLESIIRDGQSKGAFAPGDAGAAARVLFSLYVVFVQRAYVAAEAGEEALFERGLELVLDGLRARR